MNALQIRKRSRTWAMKDYIAGLIDPRVYRLLLADVAFYLNRRRVVIPKGGLAWEDIKLGEPK